jgi:excisionase family DNA binding protein
MPGKLLTTTEAAKLLEVSRDTVARWIRLDQLPAVRLPSGQYRIPREAVERLLRGR